ncbi:MAG: NAD(+)/NADH kinase [Candidatus Koribacter versatilis]|uniref:NAD kinase n=1 Tax=Candidatus Korobacter versatilis TaxID=658062 RepID=A0A932A673_9BACT|nr:NAD(+)/NADH kinase [Candidatus Koribacter versatilis]
MKSVAIISKPGRPQLPEVAARLVKWLKAHSYAVLADTDTCSVLPGLECVARETIAARKPEFVVVVGGDGTMLAAARAVAKAGIPILGVNLGSLGFMTEVRLEELEATLDAVERKQAVFDVRAMLRCELVRDGNAAEEYEALNDIVVNKAALARMVDFDVYVNRQFVSNYKADGVIVATPTGSTAYSLAAGGPILTPTVNAFVITPVSPHALTNRPLVVPDESEIAIEVKQPQEEAYLTVDGQTGEPLRQGDRIVCRKSKHTIQLLHLPQRSFFDVLRTKLKWGER